MDEENKSMARLVHNIRIKRRWAERIKKFINEMSYEEANDEFLKFLNWEKEYQERYYKKGIQTSSNLFQYICEFFEIYGKEYESDEDFFCQGFTYKCYRLEEYQGQGVVYKIYDNDKLIFHS